MFTIMCYDNLLWLYFFESDMHYSLYSVLHVSSNNPRAGCLFHFGGQKFPLFSVFRKAEKGVYIFGGIILFTIPICSS